MPSEIVILAMRAAMALFLYLFLVFVWMSIRRDLRVSAERLPTARLTADSLLVVQPGSTPLRTGEVLGLTDGATIGRSAECTISLEDQFLSQHHAAFTRRGGRWSIQDLGSTNGTYVNGRRLSAEALLAPSDVIALGSIRVRFEVGESR